KQSGNKIELSIVPFAPLRQKIISAITSGVVPDLVTVTPTEAAALQAWDGHLVDVSDVVETQKSRMSPAVLANAQLYDNTKRARSFYCVPYAGAVTPFHVWGSLIEEAGFKRSDIPGKWDAFIDFFIPVEKELQKQGMRHTYATGFVVSTIGNDPNATFTHFLIAYGGIDIVTPDGRLHTDDKQVQEAAIKALEKLSKLYQDGHIPPSSINWNDADDNNAFHSKLCVMDFDGTLSTELAMLGTAEGKEEYYHEVITQPPPLDNNGNPIKTELNIAATMIPKGAKSIEVAKEFQKFMIQPEINSEWLKATLGRFVPIYIQQGIFNPTKPDYFSYNPAWAQVRSEHTFNVAFHDIVSHHVPVKDAATKALKRLEEIFSKYP